MPHNKYDFWIDRGGTFTDVVVRTPDGRLQTRKLLSSNPEAYEDAALAAIADVLGSDPGAPLPDALIASLKMGTTVATNALLERKGEPTALVTTRGFRDAIAIGNQQRPDLFDLNVRKPSPLYDVVFEVTERVSALGEVLAPLDEDGMGKILSEARARGINALAIVFVHGYRYSAHEERAAKLARAAGFDQVTASHEANPLMKYVPRGETAIADAYLSPILRRYIKRIAAAAGQAPLYFMQSNGGLAEASAFSGKAAILSGPAGGIVGAVETAQAAGFDKLITFDMGGTSTDVSHYDGQLERSFESEVAGVRLMVPMLNIHTVAAGGGSICHFDGLRYRVGPSSAGADPGPAAYGKGGPPTITDCNVMTGKLRAEHFPASFGADGASPLDAQAALAAFKDLVVEIENATGERRSAEEIADGFLNVAVEHMARAIRQISTRRGRDVRNYTLVTFGGAGGQHACRVADALGIREIVLHPMAGVLSALGMGLADIRALREENLELPMTGESWPEAEARAGKLAAKAKAEVAAQGVPKGAIEVARRAHVKYDGSDTTLLVPLGTLGQTKAAFEHEHRAAFGFIEPGKRLVAAALMVEATGRVNRPDVSLAAQGTSTEPAAHGRFFEAGQWHDANFYKRDELAPGFGVVGPAIILEDHGTNVIEAGWRAEIQSDGNLVIGSTGDKKQRDLSGAPDPVFVEVFNNRFMSIAEEMGVVLERTAHSVNIKERLDFSCAVFDGEGELVANAPHMPVHLGSMGESVKTVARRNAGKIRLGHVYMLNDPYHGGTHLPDVTVVTPVFLEGEGEPAFFAASRGHHADIGGKTPGSLPPDSVTLAEEGIVFDNMLVVRDRKLDETGIRKALMEGPYPARNPDRNIADLKAQIAACEKGQRGLSAMVDEFGRETVSAYMTHVQNNAEESVRRVIDVLEDGALTYPMDIGAEIRVAIRVNREARTARVDFTGTSDQGAHNFNAPRAVTNAAILYAFRTLVGDEIPLNAGCLKPLEIIVPEGSLLNPRPPAAVVAGNVETSQAVTNALLLAMGQLAASQGTMNNLTFGNDRYQYYETIGGGAGAGAEFDGASATHVHMTNSRLTDPEVLEWRLPVRVEEFAIRRNSGGIGRHQGGDGIIRDIRFLEDMELSVLSSHRINGPPGLDGGGAGGRGRNTVIRADGTEEKLKGADAARMAPGDRIRIETPGGGACGVIKERG